MAAAPDRVEAEPPPKRAARLWRLVTWIIALGCFYLVYTRIEGAAAREGISAREYLDSSFRTPSDVLSELNIPVLASVPLRRTGTYKGNGSHNGNGNGNGNGSRRNGHGELHVEEAYKAHSVGEGPQ